MATIKDYEEVLADHRRIAREMDVLLNGVEGAAKAPALIDVKASIRVLVTWAQRAEWALSQTLHHAEFIGRLGPTARWCIEQVLKDYPGEKSAPASDEHP